MILLFHFYGTISFENPLLKTMFKYNIFMTLFIKNHFSKPTVKFLPPQHHSYLHK